MPAFYAGKRVGKPLMGGHTYNAMFNGKLVWPLDRDTVVSIRITDDKGKPLPKSLAVSGTLKLGAKATYADGHVGDLLTTKDVTFTSRDTSTATVSGNTLTWRHGGTILVTATVNGFTSAAASIASAYAPESIKVTRPRLPRRTAISESSWNTVLPRTSGCDPTTRALGGGL